ncbi:uncharacterized protein [Nicotiana tomentosiformis]|uniref:uncharacterized protein n=1 Tax=Nicotiana tomentosiformis TaxID=4098 RepID=UPI00388C586A
MEKWVDATDVMPMVEGEGSKEPAQKEVSDDPSFRWTEDEDDNKSEEERGVVDDHEEHQTQDMDNEEKKSENEGDSGEEKESGTENKVDEQVNDSVEEEKYIEEEDDYESECEDQEKTSECKGEDKESEEKNENTSGESEGSMTIGNIVIAPSKEASGEKMIEETGPLLTPFIGYEEASSDEDHLPLSAIGKKTRKTPVKIDKSVIPARKGVAFPARSPLTRNKRKVVDEQIIKESRGAKMPRNKVSVVEPVIELDGEDESDSALLENSSTQKRKVVKSTKTATPSTRASRGKKRKSVPVVVDKLTKFKNRKVLNGKILANTDEKRMTQLVEKLELQG